MVRRRPQLLFPFPGFAFRSGTYLLDHSDTERTIMSRVE